ncbi:MAG TPA: pyruvate formate lyase family protein [Armatimonadota bacterium]|nr:pyruvate formate lyase family protein [Armatimonadota bacterium]
MTRVAESTTALVREAADRLFGAADTVSLERARLVTDAYRIFDDQPVPLKRALAFRHVLQHMTLDLEANPLFAGNTSPALRAWMLIPEYGFGEDVQLRYEHADLAGFLDMAARVPTPLATALM